MSVAWWLICRPTIGQHTDQHYRPVCQSTITWHIGQYADPESVYRYGNQESADKLIEYRPIVSIEGCTNRPFPSSRKSHFQTEAKCETFVVKRCTCCCTCRLQNSPYFCVFKYTRAVKQKVWNEAENRERDWGETLKIQFLSHARRACEARAVRAVRARKTLTSRFTDFFTDFEEKTDCFAVSCTWWLKRGENHSFEGSGLSVYLGGNTISK